MNETDVGLSELPDGWVWTTLGEIIEPSKEKINPQKIKEVPYISLEHIEKDTGKLLGRGCSSEVKSTKTKFNRGDLLYGKLRPYLNKVYLSDFEGICSTDLLVFPKSDLRSNEFLLYRLLCRDFVSYASHNVSGVNLPRVNFQTLAQFKIPLPPLHEQRRIVAKIEELFTKLDAGIDALRKVGAQLKRYRQSVLKAAFEGKLTEAWRAEHQEAIEPASPVENDLPAGWDWTTLEDCAQILDSRRVPINAKEREARISGKPRSELYPYYGATGQVGWIDDFLFDDELILLGEDGAPFLDFSKDKAYLIEGKSWVNNHAHVLKGRTEITSNQLLCYYLNTVDYQNYVTGTTRLKLNQSLMRKIPVSLPSLPEQQAIVSEIERRLSVADKVEKTVTTELKRAEQLRQSILKQAFSGKLAPQDSSDEPASVLLERVKAGNL